MKILKFVSHVDFLTCNSKSELFQEWNDQDIDETAANCRIAPFPQADRHVLVASLGLIAISSE